MDFDLLSHILTSTQQPRYRLKQIKASYFSGRFREFSQMTDIPISLRQDLTAKIPYTSVSLEKIIQSPGTQKALLRLHDGKLIETVLMDYDNWLTVCVSSQVGCPLGCSFCATGKMGFIRNLTQSEIVDQIVFWQQQLYPRYVGRVVLMGMGEPLLNWDQVVSALEIINSPQCLNIGSRKISLSTAGIIPGIKDLIKTHPQINLAISLHSANQSKRSQIMPIARQYSLEDLSQTCRFYTRQTGRQLFFEYALIKDFNDSESDINGLAKLIKTDPLFFLNLIPLNPVPGGLPPSPTSTIRRIESQLNQLRVPYSLRRTFGQNIAAACGQLATPK